MQFNSIFTGKNFIELDTVDSTNNYAANLLNTTKVLDGTVIMAHYQSLGRGQMGSEWISNPSENLTCSIVYRTSLITAKNIFVMSKVAAIAARETVQQLTGLEAKIKWPNDVYLNNKKVSGMLIENHWQGAELSCVIGIGINVNQTSFENQPLATSCSLETGKVFPIENVLKLLVKNLEYYYLKIRAQQFRFLHDEYIDGLLFFGQRRRFSDLQETFVGTITAVLDTGHLEITMSNSEKRLFAFKEVQFVL